jgi:hypothetical protein
VSRLPAGQTEKVRAGRAANQLLSIDGLQPEKGHETLYVVRELTQRRVWFAEPLISAAADEVRRLIKKAREWAEALGKAVALWLSDRQEGYCQILWATIFQAAGFSCFSPSI